MIMSLLVLRVLYVMFDTPAKANKEDAFEKDEALVGVGST